jgi:hypothetical protein
MYCKVHIPKEHIAFYPLMLNSVQLNLFVNTYLRYTCNYPISFIYKQLIGRKNSASIIAQLSVRVISFLLMLHFHMSYR